MLFKDRKDAGQKLTVALAKYKNEKIVVFGLARGGVPVAYEVAKTFNAPLGVVVVRKLGFPFQPELGFGAIAPGVLVLNDDILKNYPLSAEQIDYVRSKEEVELARRMREYRGDQDGYDLEGKTAIIVDDGIATGITNLAGIRYIKNFKPKKIVAAAPVCAHDTVQKIKSEVDDFVYLFAPSNFGAIGEFYEDFSQVTDEEVKRLLVKLGTNPCVLSRSVT